MNVASIFKSIGKFTSDHAPEIMTGLSVYGTIQTAYFAGKATVKATRIVDADELENDMIVDVKERWIHRTELVWRLYIPAIATGVTTIGLTICSNRLSVKRQAALASALVTTQSYLAKYKDAVNEVLDEHISEENIAEKVDEAYGKRVAESHPEPEYIETVGKEVGDEEFDIFQDTISGRYFKAHISDVKEAFANVKLTIADDTYISLNEYYAELGLERTEQGDYLGWNIDSRFEPVMRPGVTNKGRPCIQIHYRSYPKDGAYRIG